MSRGYVPMILDWDRRSPLPNNRTIFCPGVHPRDIWNNTGTGDGEVLAALISQCSLLIGIDSGPLHVAGATDTPTIGVWTAHHPIQFYDLCPNVLHLIPNNWRQSRPCCSSESAEYFLAKYAHVIYSDLEEALMSQLRVQLPPRTRSLHASTSLIDRGNH